MLSVDWYSNVPTCFILLATLAALLYLYGRQPFGVWTNLGVSGPPPHIFWGNIPELFDDNIGTRATINRWQKQFGRIFGAYIFRKPALVVTNPEVLKQVFVKDFDNFTDRFLTGDGNFQQRIIKKGLFFADGADWKRIRRIMSPAFSSGKLKLLTHYMNLTAQRLGENLKQLATKGAQAEARTVFGAFTLDVICGTAFGLDTNSQGNLEGPFIQHAKSLMTFDKLLHLQLSLIGTFPILGPIFKRFGVGLFKSRDVLFLERNLAALINDKRNNPGTQNSKDFLQLLMDAEADADDEFVGEKKLTTEEIVAQSILFVIAGYETTSTTLQFLGFELAKNQEVQNKVRQEISEILGNNTEPDYDRCLSLKYTESVIKETLRMYPPVNLLSRLSERAATLRGIPVPRHTAILIPIGSICRDPEFFPDPDSFKPERFLDENKHQINPISFLPFGYGPRLCIGMRLALMELKIALVHILRSVTLIDVTPEVIAVDEYAGKLAPKVPIKLSMEPLK